MRIHLNYTETRLLLKVKPTSLRFATTPMHIRNWHEHTHTHTHIGTTWWYYYNSRSLEQGQLFLGQAAPLVLLCLVIYRAQTTATKEVRGVWWLGGGWKVMVVTEDKSCKDDLNYLGEHYRWHYRRMRNDVKQTHTKNTITKTYSWREIKQTRTHITTIFNSSTCQVHFCSPYFYKNRPKAKTSKSYLNIFRFNKKTPKLSRVIWSAVKIFGNQLYLTTVYTFSAFERLCSNLNIKRNHTGKIRLTGGASSFLRRIIHSSAV